MIDVSIIAAFLLYFGILTIIGCAARFNASSAQDFVLGNRSINYWITAIAAHASDMSAWLFMGFPAAIYLHGLVSSWIAIGLVLGMFVSWHFIAQPLRLATDQYQTITVSGFLEKHFNDTSGHISLVSSLALIIFFIVYIAAGLTGLGHVFETVFHIDYLTGMTLGLAISLFYVLLGGFIAIAWNHFFQGTFLLCMIGLVPLVGLAKLGTIQTILAQADLRNISLSLFPKNTDSWLSVLNGLTWGIGYLGMPHVIVNYMGIDDPHRIKYAKYVGMSWLVLSLFFAVLVGLIGIGFFPVLYNPELVFVRLVQGLFYPFFAGLILCAILAATMSTIDTQLLVAASSLSHDILIRFFKKFKTYPSNVLNRSILVGIAAISYLLAFSKSHTIMGLVSYAWSGLSSTFSPSIVLALYGKKIPARFVTLGMLTGALVSGIWPFMEPNILPLIPGCCAHMIIILIGYIFKD